MCSVAREQVPQERVPRERVPPASESHFDRLLWCITLKRTILVWLTAHP